MCFRAGRRGSSDVVSCGAPPDPAPAFPASALRPPRARTAFPARHLKILCAFRRRRPKACPPGRQDIRRKTHVRPVRHLPASELSCTIASRILTKSFPAMKLFGQSARVGHSPPLLHEGASELGEILLPGTARCKVGFPPGHPAGIPAGQRGRTAQGTAPRDPPLTGRAAIRHRVRPGAGRTAGSPDGGDSREACPQGQGRPPRCGGLRCRVASQSWREHEGSGGAGCSQCARPKHWPGSSVEATAS